MDKQSSVFVDFGSALQVPLISPQTDDSLARKEPGSGRNSQCRALHKLGICSELTDCVFERLKQASAFHNRHVG